MMKKIILVFLCTFFCANISKPVEPVLDPNVINIQLNCKRVSGLFCYLTAGLLAYNSYRYLVGDDRPPMQVRGNNRNITIIHTDAFPKSTINSLINGMGAILSFYIGSKFFLN